MNPDWIAVDWGTSNLRVWAMGPEGVLAHASSDEGMGKLARDGFEAGAVAADCAVAGRRARRPLSPAAWWAAVRAGWRRPIARCPALPVAPGALIAVPTLIRASRCRSRPA